jgi:hypothetical protein
VEEEAAEVDREAVREEGGTLHATAMTGATMRVEGERMESKGRGAEAPRDQRGATREGMSLEGEVLREEEEEHQGDALLVHRHHEEGQGPLARVQGGLRPAQGGRVPVREARRPAQEARFRAQEGHQHRPAHEALREEQRAGEARGYVVVEVVREERDKVVITRMALRIQAMRRDLGSISASKNLHRAESQTSLFETGE